MAVFFDDVLAENEDKKIPVALSNALANTTMSDADSLRLESQRAQEETTAIDRNRARDAERLKQLEDKENKKNKKGTLEEFASSVGGTLSNVASFIPNTIDKVFEDPQRKRNFMRGLKIIEESSRYTPLGEARSPLGKIAKGIIDESEDFERTQIAKLKAQKVEPRFRDIREEGILKSFDKYQTKQAEKEKGYRATDTRFTELYKLADMGLKSPTGLVENFLTPFQKIAYEIGLGGAYEDLSKKIGAKKDLSELTTEDKIAFKDLFSSSAKQLIVNQVKDLYPASDKDIAVLLSGAGDVTTNSKALAKLVSAEKSAKEIDVKSEELAPSYAFDRKDVQFERKSKEEAARILAKQYADKVKPETLRDLFGDDPENNKNPFRIISAYNYQQLSPKYEKTLDPFKKFTENQAQKNQEIKNLIIDQQKKLSK